MLEEIFVTPRTCRGSGCSSEPGRRVPAVVSEGFRPMSIPVRIYIGRSAPCSPTRPPAKPLYRTEVPPYKMREEGDVKPGLLSTRGAASK